MRRLPIAILVLAALVAPAAAEMVTVTPAQLGDLFCTARQGNDDLILSGALSEELRTLIAYSEARDATIAAAHPDEKPPLGDGIPWSSFPDYADGCAVGSVMVEGAIAKVQINYTFATATDANYADTLTLVQQPHRYDPDTGIWRIDDVAYTTGGTLKTMLNEAFAAQ